MNALQRPTEQHLWEIVEQVWTSYLDPEDVNPLVPVASPPPSDDLSAAVSLTGAWCGHVVVSFSALAARNAAAALLGIETGQVTGADITDAVGELANVIGGNVKGLLPEPSALSLPYVLSGAARVGRWPSVTELCQLSGIWLDEPVTVSVLESTTDHVRATA
jgi:chemotaxis protein CheX